MRITAASFALLALSSLTSAEHITKHKPRVLKRAETLPAVPPGNQVYLGAWLNGGDGYSDTPAAMNARLNLSLPVYQLGQRIPLAPYDYVAGTGWPAFTYLIDFTNTNTAYWITVYPDDGLAAVTDGDLVALGQQFAGYEAAGRTVYLRWAPEMQGTWFAYGGQPTLYLSVWKRMYSIIKELAPSTQIIWSPNFSYGYNWGQSLSAASAADQKLLDTDGDGRLTYKDDAYAPYFPGDEFLDWAGVSLYYKGPDLNNVDTPQAPGTCSQMLDGTYQFGNHGFTPFYATYCSNRPCALSEAGAAHHVNVQPARLELPVHQAFWQDCFTNATFLDAHPAIKILMLFEHQKLETDQNGADLRDYRITNDTASAAAFRSDLVAMGDRFMWATPLDNTVVETAMPLSNPTLVGTGAQTVTLTGVSEVITWTQTTYASPTGNNPTIALSAATGTAAAIVNTAAGSVSSLSSAALGNNVIKAVSSASTLAAFGSIGCFLVTAVGLLVI